MEDIYSELTGLTNQTTREQITRRSDLRQIYFDFLKDFKNYLSEFMRESLVELVVAELPVSTTPVQLFDGEHGGLHLVVKNQGSVQCWLTTAGQGGFCLDPGEKERFWLNKPVVAVTLSGNTTLGLIRT